ncbi:amino acid ABC transporter ATP-binding protein, PAAT family [Paracoccus solventivorans]|uniref:Amino acid ABC transporter ATP-binding protein n=1 Tax=Paracoccus solventivorans TaxID=53463 RepID=A0A1M7IRF0_9RHOB|nr:amino acid ABC transporter ATP-binding protein [Paracoccus solventivorans]SHM42937.1 amino acid ABC transporter ATP-binding protein, PAAT family [Paracoccus solventivorans]HHW32929.1 amino acid ABC transporter ATP-binding protein [Paracoccus solventivorans]
MSEAQTPAGPPVVSLKKINIRYGNHHAVRDVSLDIARGEVVAMVGPSGAGKSTLLRAINMLETPSSGTLHVGDFTFSLDHRLSQKELLALRRSTGMVFQQFNLFPHMTVEKNISLPQMRVLGRSRAEADKVTARLLERVHLADKAKAYPARLSGGQQQRIAIARALALDPKVMLFDEPTSALDPELGLDVLEVMRELAADGMTMIVVTHEIAFAAEVADRVIVMADGEIIEQGPPDQVIRNPQLPRTQKFFRAILDRH